MSNTPEPKLISGNANMPLAKAIARRMSLHRGVNVDLVDARVERFNDSEVFVEVFENVRGEDMFIIQSTSNPANDNLMELLIMADALRRSSAQRVTAVLPYFGYARQDRRTKARTPITAKLVANMLVGTGIERILTMDLHAAQIQGFFDIPVDNLYASPVFALDIKNEFKDRMDELLIISPDVGGVARARELAKRLNAPLAIVDKRREKAGEVSEMTVIGDVKGKTCLIIDDICDTAGTLCKAAEVLLENGAKEVHGLHQSRRDVWPCSRARHKLGNEITCYYRQHCAYRCDQTSAEYSHCSDGTDLCPSNLEHLERHVRFVAV